MIKFNPVTHRHDRVLIVGGGESLVGVDLSPIKSFDGAVITVNNVIFHIPRADYWFTVDPSGPQVAMIDTRPNTYYYAAVPRMYGDSRNPDLAFRYPAPPNIHYLERIVPYDNFRLQEDPTKITTGDSIFGALGLAYHFGAKLIVMIGVDVYGYGHFYDPKSPYNGYYMPEDRFEDYKSNIPSIYADSVEQLTLGGIRVVNGSPDSRITCFEKMTPQAALAL